MKNSFTVYNNGRPVVRLRVDAEELTIARDKVSVIDVHEPENALVPTRAQGPIHASLFTVGGHLIYPDYKDSTATWDGDVVIELHKGVYHCNGRPMENAANLDEAMLFFILLNEDIAEGPVGLLKAWERGL